MPRVGIVFLMFLSLSLWMLKESNLKILQAVDLKKM